MAEKSALKRAIVDRILWGFSFKHRKILIPLILALIAVFTFMLVQNYVSMQTKVARISKYEPIYVLSTKRHLDAGDVIQQSDLKAMIFFKSEFEKTKTIDPATGVGDSALITCSYDSNTKALTGFNNVIGRIVKVPVFEGALLRKDFFAEEGALPGLKNLLAKDHTLLDVLVEQIGFNIFIKPGDRIDLYKVNREGTSSPIAKLAEVILVDSMPLGKAPFQVPVDASRMRNLTVALPDNLIPTALAAKKSGNLIATYRNTDFNIAKKKATKKPNLNNSLSSNPFQSLTMIRGTERRTFGGSR